MNSDSREFRRRRRNCLAIAAHLRDRAPKHEHQADAKKEFADDFCFHVIYFSFLFWLSVNSRLENSFLAFTLSFGKFWRAWQKSFTGDRADPPSPKLPPARKAMARGYAEGSFAFPMKQAT
jgi:hypothetical protein